MEKGMIGRASNLAPTVRQNHFCMYRFFKKYILWYNFVLDFLSVPISLTPSARFLGKIHFLSTCIHSFFFLHTLTIFTFPLLIPCSHFSCSRTFVQIVHTQYVIKIAFWNFLLVTPGLILYWCLQYHWSFSTCVGDMWSIGSTGSTTRNLEPLKTFLNINWWPVVADCYCGCSIPFMVTNSIYLQFSTIDDVVSDLSYQSDMSQAQEDCPQPLTNFINKKNTLSYPWRTKSLTCPPVKTMIFTSEEWSIKC